MQFWAENDGNNDEIPEIQGILKLSATISQE